MIEGTPTREISLSNSIQHTLEAYARYQKQYTEKWKQLSGSAQPETSFSLAEIIQQRGCVPLHMFMIHALYGRDGYYSSGRARPNSGDFTTPSGNVLTVAAILDKGQQFVRNNDNMVIAGSGKGHFENHMFQAQGLVGNAPLPQQLISLDYSVHLLQSQKETPVKLYQHTDRSGQLTQEMTFFPDGRLRACWGNSTLILQPDVTQKLISRLSQVNPYEPTEDAPISEEAFRICESVFDTNNISTAERETFYFIIFSEPTLLSQVVKTGQALRYTKHSRIAASAGDIPLRSDSTDIFHSVELFDAFSPVVFVEDKKGNSFFPVVALDRQGKFFLSYEQVPADLVSLLDLKKRYLRETHHKPAQFTTLRGEELSLITLNVDAINAVAEAARILTPGGVMVTTDYAGFQDPGSYVDWLFFATLQNGTLKWDKNLLVDIADYTFPYQDISCVLEPPFLSWVGHAFGLSKQEVTPLRDVVDRYIVDTHNAQISRHYDEESVHGQFVVHVMTKPA